MKFKGKKLLITCMCLHKMKLNQPPSFVNLLIGDDGQRDMPNSSNIPLNPPNWQYYSQYPFQQPYPPPQYPSQYPPPQNPSQYPPPQNPAQYPPPQNPSYIYGTMPPVCYPTQPLPTSSSNPSRQGKKKKITNEGGGLGAK